MTLSKNLCERDLHKVIEALDKSVNDRWYNIGIALKLRSSDLDCIDRDFPTQEKKLIEVIKLWLKGSLAMQDGNPPTWEILIEAVQCSTGGDNPALAERIRANKLSESQPSADAKSGTKSKGKSKRKKKKNPIPNKANGCTTAKPPIVIPPVQQAVPARPPVPRQNPVTIPQRVCRILIFRISLYLGAIFDGILERPRKQDAHVEVYKSKRNGNWIHFVDSFGPEIRERDETFCCNLPDSILFCLPLTADAKTIKHERDTIEKIKKLLKPEIFERAVITLTIPKSLSEEELDIKLQNRKRNLEASFEKYEMPPVVCISEDLMGSVPGYPEWYSQLWLEIFKSCSKEGLPIMSKYLADRMHKPPDLVPNQTSDLLRPIPKDACDKAKWLMGDYIVEDAATRKNG